MNIEGWKYYNHAAIPACAPHETPAMDSIADGSIWRIRGFPLFARWTSNWDCGYETNWWYVIKDEPFDISALKSKRRYEINKGNKNFEIKIINPYDCADDLYRVTIEALSAWPEKYRPKINRGKWSVEGWEKYVIFGAYGINKKILEGYAIVEDCQSYASFSVLRTNPKSEKLGINAAIVYGILQYFSKRFNGSFYICDGERSIRHETAFQDYLEKYFELRKAYCKLNIKYRMGFGVAVRFLFPFRKILKGKTSIGSSIIAVLKMEEIRRGLET